MPSYLFVTPFQYFFHKIGLEIDYTSNQAIVQKRVSLFVLFFHDGLHEKENNNLKKMTPEIVKN